MFIEKNLISRLLHNLIYNSVLHNPNGCQISILLKDLEDTFQIIVKDNGIGVTSEKLANLYTQENTDMDISGVRRHGMGLKISRQIIQVHGGNMKIDSQINHYFKVTLTLPIAKT